MHLTVDQVDSVLAGMTYPAQRWELLTWAEYNGSGRVIMDALDAIPEGRYCGPAEVVAAVAVHGELVAARVERSRCIRQRNRANMLAARISA